MSRNEKNKSTTQMADKKWFIVMAAVIVCFAFNPPQAGADTHYVSPGQSIQAAIDVASNGDEIEVSPGTYIEAINFNGKAVRLYSSGGPYATTIDANGAYHVVQCVSGEGANTILEGFTITGGNAKGGSWPHYNGGGMLNYQSSPTVTNCNFCGNTATYGGGMYNNYSSPALTNCNFSGNKAWDGGGMHNYPSSYPKVTNCNFSGNTAENSAGGMYNYYSSPALTNCIFSGNTALDGGGMFNGESNPTVINCTFSGNQANSIGGGMYNENYSRPIVTNCIFSGNQANNIGGGMYNEYYSSPIVTNCTFSGNSANYGGGGMYNEYYSSPIVTNCTFSGNSANYGGGGMYNSISSSPAVTNCIIGGNKAGTSGGGMQNSDSNPTVTNCTFIDNEADSYGGGVLNDTGSYPWFVNCIFIGNVSGTYSGGMGNNLSSPTLTNCTFCGNLANVTGGGMLNYDSCKPVVTNCILWGNSPNQILDWSGTGCSTTVNYSDVQDNWSGAGSNNINADPLFVNAAGGDLRLSSSSSPSVDTGDNSAAGLPATDLAGNPRVSDGNKDHIAVVDMGAYEYIETLRLVAHWKLDEYYGPTAHDSAGENHGTLQGGPFWLPTWGKVGGALQLDGKDDYVDCGNNDSLNIIDKITVALWVKTNDAGNGEHNPYVTKGDHSYAIKHYYDNTIQFFIYDSDWHTVWYPIDSSFNGVWHHLAGTYDGNDLKLYCDGDLIATSHYVGSIASSAYNVNIGRNSEWTDRFYEGLIDDVRIYNFALSADEILQLLCTRQINGDLDGNCKVDFRDLALLVSEWLTCNLPSYELCWE